mgnify:CR=1 FL=1
MNVKITKVVPRPRQARAVETIEAAIDATNAALKVGGEGAVRIQEISEKTGISVGSLYHHFGDREGLIRATYVHNFERTTQADVEQIRSLVQDSYSTEELRNHTPDFEKFLSQVHPRESALERATMLGQIASRPLLREALAEAQHRVTNSLAEVMQLLRDRGLLKEHVTPRTAAILLQVLLFGRVIAELDSDPVSDEEWTGTVLSALGGLIQFK